MAGPQHIGLTGVNWIGLLYNSSLGEGQSLLLRQALSAEDRPADGRLGEAELGGHDAAGPGTGWTSPGPALFARICILVLSRGIFSLELFWPTPTSTTKGLDIREGIDRVCRVVPRP